MRVLTHAMFAAALLLAVLLALGARLSVG